MPPTFEYYIGDLPAIANFRLKKYANLIHPAFLLKFRDFFMREECAQYHNIYPGTYAGSQSTYHCYHEGR
jgi:hypothetical protein